MEQTELPTIVKLDVAKVEINDIDNQNYGWTNPNNLQVIKIDKKFVESFITIEGIGENSVNIKTEEFSEEQEDSFVSHDEIKVEYEDNVQKYDERYSNEEETSVDDLASLELSNSHTQPESSFPPYGSKTCDSCNISFETRKLLLEHLFIEHKKEIPRCGKCRKIFYTEHVSMRHKCLKCKFCGKNMFHKFTFYKHLMTHANGKEKEEMRKKLFKSFDCYHCAKSYSDKTALKCHIQFVHYGLKYSCPKCGREYSKKNSCFNCQPTVACLACDKKVNLNGMRTHLRFAHKTRFQKEQYFCLKCKSYSPNVDSWIAHLNSVSHNEQPDDPKVLTDCLICKKKLSKMSHMLFHMKTVHGIQFKCDIFHCVWCNGNRFTSLVDVVKHVQSKNHKTNKIPKFKCKKCEKCFFHAKTLGIHERSRCIAIKSAK